MFRFGPVLVAVALLCVWAMGCSEDSPTTPAEATTGTVVVNSSPDSLSCPWQLTGPSSYSHNGTGGETLSDLTPGDYTLTWGAVTGWNLPDPVSQTQTLAAGGTTTFAGTYVQQAGSISIDPEPNSINAQWQLTGPSSYSHTGTGDETVTGMTPGDYTITWFEKAGWNSPSPAVETKTLVDDSSLTFTGTYTVQAGTIVVDPEPDAINAPWQLTGPASYSLSGTGDQTIPSLVPGDYTLTWGTVSGYDSPNPGSETLTLAAEGSMTFSGTYTSQAQTGTINVQPQNYTDAPWHLDGPNSYSYDGQAHEQLTNMEIGNYTVTWGDVVGWNTPNPTTQTLTEDGTVTFYGTYYLPVSDLLVDTNPSSINPPWHIDGPDGWTYDGTGDVHLSNLPMGDYTITWGEISEWNLPDPASETMTLDESFWQTFVGNYTQIQVFVPDMVLIPAGTFQMGSPESELGRFDIEPQHWVQLSSFYICKTELTDIQYQWLYPEHEFNHDGNTAIYYFGRMTWFTFCNLLSVQDGYQPCYTIDGSDVTWDQNADGYRLPTEAEWEYACRAGTTTAFANGEITDIACDDPVLDLIAWYCGNSQFPPYQVATKLPNAWGLFDMHGNANEWAWDRYGDYGTGTFEDPDINPTGPPTGNYWIMRGGSKDNAARNCRSARRFSTSASSGGGLRLARNAP